MSRKQRQRHFEETFDFTIVEFRREFRFVDQHNERADHQIASRDDEVKPADDGQTFGRQADLFVRLSNRS
jgi:hypothetical protein